jgi:hypothetical protein
MAAFRFALLFLMFGVLLAAAQPETDVGGSRRE